MTVEDKNNLGVTQPVKVLLPVGQTAAPLWAVIIVSSISLLVFVGWLFEVDFLKRIFPGYVFMNPTTAVAFILSSVSLWFLHSANAKLIRLAQACAGAVALIGLIKLCAIVGFFDIGIDQILFSDQLFDKVTEQPNRMAPTTALNFLLLGAALLLLNFETKRGRDSFPSQYLAIAVILSSFLAIIGYLYGAKSFYAIASFNPMAIHTAVSFFALAVGLLLSKPERGLVKEILSRDIGGETARRLFPLVIIVPIVLGWLRLKGEHFGLFAGEIGTTMFVVTIILIFSVIVLKDARLMNVTAAKRKQAENELLKLGSIVESSGDAIISKTLNGIIISWNSGAERVFGYTAEEIVGQHIFKLFPLELTGEEAQILEKITRGERIEHYETVRVRKDGKHIPVSLTVSPVKNAGGNVIGISKIARDITERKLNEEKIEKFAAELQRSNSELQDFASVASHDLQEPLRKIQSFADELKINIGHSIEAEDLDTLERMIAAAGRMRNLINDLLAFSRITTMAKPFMLVDLNLLLKEVLSDLEVRTRDSGGQIEAGHLPTIDADPLQMRQLLQNLIGNGLKFHRAGVAPIIKISGTNGEAHCHLTIADNGIGFDEKYLDRIFTIFQRLHGRNEYEGTGIGLAICRKIVERHGGELTARSAVGEGATFIITLPVKQSKEEK